ncbi:MAG TPA: anthranilate synthase component I [Polyangia bacterium]
METKSAFMTAGGIGIARTVLELPYGDGDATAAVLEGLDSRRGVLLGSSYEYPGRYARYDLAFVDPPLVIEARGRGTRVSALNARGAVLLPAVAAALAPLPAVAALEPVGDDALDVRLVPQASDFPEEERSRQPSVFSLLRAIGEAFASDDAHLGLYGAFGYDLALQFEPLRLRSPRLARARDLVLYLPDDIVAVDHRRELAQRIRYDFAYGGRSTVALPRTPVVAPASPPISPTAIELNRPVAGTFAEMVRSAKVCFRRGDLFEVTPSHTLRVPCPAPPTELYRRLRARNPAPYGFLMNLGDGEHLVGASPEMYVRVQGDRVETCPIAGTIARGANPLGDAEQIRRLLDSRKDEAELTMCTDVDRNDKSRICVPGTVRVLGRRQIELYSRLIHTVDHVEGRLRPGFDALDAFLTHTWAVTVTGAPKTAARQFIEDHEADARRWYGGAVGRIGFNGQLSTGITLRTIRIEDGIAEVRVGATLLSDSEPDDEERETELKASALLDALQRPLTVDLPTPVVSAAGTLPRVLMIDHADSFVHTLGSYFRQAGAEVVTRRAGLPLELLDAYRPDLLVLSPGPGRPSDFGMSALFEAALTRALAVFGVCLGLQGMVEHCGGRLHVLAEPMHGKPSPMVAKAGRLFDGLPLQFQAGRYHSLHAKVNEVPPALRVTAETADGVVMAVEHRTLPWSAVQFHPESILTSDGDLGLTLIGNVLARSRARPPA